ncbi:MAG: FHA domain-containing protein [Bacteroidales bacterium]|nr:FHA domain-containing protein [Bacteroidales bacterium]
MALKPLYSRSGASSKSFEGTHIPDMENAISSAPEKAPREEKKDHTLMSGEPIVGFLYSVSRTSAGEYWPLHLGENTIGRDDDNDIVLSEMTVSGHHATLNIRRMKTTKEYLADIYVRGVNGGFVNEDEVRKEAECKNGDFLTIGDNYVLYLILVNPFELGMKVAENFVAAEQTSAKKEESIRDEFDLDSDRTSTSGRMYDSRRRPQGGTEGLDGDSDTNEGFTSHLL